MKTRETPTSIHMRPPELESSSVVPADTRCEPEVKHNGRAVDRRRLLGAYYTPDDLAGLLVEWALESAAGTLLDPSFGGCAFLNAATRVLKGKGVDDPGRLVHGVDIESRCIDYVRATVGLLPENCLVRDFLEVRPHDLPGAPFEAIVGNPPYVRHHWLKNSTRSAARLVIEESPTLLPATASIWAYFVVHALRFLAPGGRLAMLVPEALLQADYAAPVRDALAANFSSVSLIHIRDRLFEGTRDPVVMIAGAGFGKAGELRIESVESAEDLVGVLNGSTSQRRPVRVTVANGRSVSPTVLQVLQELSSSGSIRKLGSLATLRIGFVTGANSHFIRSRSNLKQLRIPNKASIPIVSRTRWLSGLEFTPEDHTGLTATGRQTHLVRPTPALEDHPGVRDWIAEGVETGAHQRFKCTRRSTWFRVDLPPAPDAMATCTRLGSPLLVLNRARYRCTNALHAVYWSRSLDVDPEVIAIGFLTSAVSVWAELHGRRYGGGVLKIDLGSLAKVPIPLVPNSRDAFEEIDHLLRTGREADARALADSVVLEQGLGIAKPDIELLQLALRDLKAQRDPADRRSNGGRRRRR